MSGGDGFGDGGGGDGVAGAGEAGSSYAGFDGRGDPVSSSARPASDSRGTSNGGGQQPAPGRHDAPPQSWAREQHQHWATVPEPLRPYLHERERQAHEQITKLGGPAKQHGEIAAAFEKHGLDRLPQGMTHSQVVEGLLAAGRALKNNPGPVLAHLAKINGVDLAQLAGFGGNAPAMLQQATQRAAQAEHMTQILAQQVETLRAELTRRDAQGREAEARSKAERERHIREAKRQAPFLQRSGPSGPAPKGSIRDSLQRHANRLMGG